MLGIKKSVHILKPRNCCHAKLSAEDVCRTDNFLNRLDNISSSSYLLLWIKITSRIFLALLLHIILLPGIRHYGVGQYGGTFLKGVDTTAI